MRPDWKLLSLLFLVAEALVAIGHWIEGIYEWLGIVLIVLMILSMIAPPAILAFRMRPSWITLSATYLAFGLPVYVVTGLYFSNFDYYPLSELKADFIEILPQAYLLFGSIAIVAATAVSIVRNKRLKRLN